jgi:hypothetical protein
MRWSSSSRSRIDAVSLPISCSVASSPAYQRVSRYSVALSIATAIWLARSLSAFWASGVKAASSGPSMLRTPTSLSRHTSGIASSATTPGKSAM